MTAVAGDRGPRWADVSALVLVAATAALAVLSYPRLPAEMVVGWRVGLDGGVARTHGPRLVGAALLPALSVALYAGLRTVPRLVAFDGATERRLYDAAVHLLLATLCAGQAVVVGANLG